MELVPPHLTFDLTFPNPHCEVKLRNPSRDLSRFFAVRTTNLLATFRFKPSRGLLGPGQSVVVSVTMADEKRESVLRHRDFQCRDDFMIASTIASSIEVEAFLKIDQEDHTARRAYLNSKVQGISGVDKLVFKAVFVPPAKYDSDTANFSMRKAAIACLPSTLLMPGLIVLSKREIRLQPGPFCEISMKVMNRSDFYLIVTIIQGAGLAPHNALSVSPNNFLIRPKRAEEIVVSGKNIPHAMRVEFSVSASNVIDPNVIDVLERTRDGEPDASLHDDVFRRFWDTASPRRRLWTGSFRCVAEENDLDETKRRWYSCWNPAPSVRPLVLIQKKASTPTEEDEEYDDGEQVLRDWNHRGSPLGVVQVEDESQRQIARV